MARLIRAEPECGIGIGSGNPDFNILMTNPPLKSLHPDSALSREKLAQFSKLSTDDLLDSLSPGRPGSLKTRPDGTVIDGHHRLAVLRQRGVDIEALPREVIPKDVPNP